MNQTIKIVIYWVLVVVIIFSVDMIISHSFSLKEKQKEIKIVDCSCSSTNCKTHTPNGDWVPTNPKCFTSDENCFYCCLDKIDLIK